MPCNKNPGNHFTHRKFFEKHFFKMEYRSILLLWLFLDDVVFIRNILKDILMNGVLFLVD
ncbi:hypothetical protein DKG82_06505 [Salmonella enterica subsp. enterica serovar Lexington]|uniref:hypothetical protein n=1 Tax=Salmonella enterica TaxID=28901 RepID=UPI0003EB5050|nr:hypothetical protein [Salmonella enterica]EAA0559592.1 hypothetical protein [Salmonella enterica subsp. enterica serovar Lexington]ECC3316289.1 hypothetical protein [Salmonella enterica subsp. enterica]EDW0191068.1 hypothetical protein [Salmonella enterica subsp. enterica serovar Orion]MMB24219.1 hypothetical protein [Salmonella enterica subsp. enterica serovar Agona]EAA7875081.1 hypothetical protein [Salmonella enterica subsp. enterica serovar Lexington]